jgi:thiamine kinase-like enzyme
LVLVHGDNISSNIVPADGGVRIVDWETFGRGDPMWDLGFLVGADSTIMEGEAEAEIAEYQRNAPANRDHPAWHRNRWAEFKAIRRHDPGS